MIYAVTSKFWLERTHSGNCAVCYVKFCRTCVPCLDSRSGMPCACKTEGVCNRCWTQHVVVTAIDCCDNPLCGRKVVKCPMCRGRIQVDIEGYNWCRETVNRHNLTGSEE